jgi:hypothetical protein
MRHCGCCCSFDWIKVVKLHIRSKKHGGHPPPPIGRVLRLLVAARRLPLLWRSLPTLAQTEQRATLAQTEQAARSPRGVRR